MTVNTDESLPRRRLSPELSTGQEAYLAPETTLDIILESLGELIEYELAVVLSYESDGRLIVKRARGPLASSELSGYSISLAEREDLALIIASGKPRLFLTDSNHQDTYKEILDLPEGHSCLAAPLAVDGRVIGLLTLDHRRCGVFSEQILRLIGAISRLIAVALLQSEASRSLRERNVLLLAERNRLLDLDALAFRDLAGSSSVWLQAMESIKLVASTDSPVLLLGETGTGKEEAARAVHRLSSRAGGPFIALNCSSMPPSLAESELFGHEKGSFTGAQALRRGRFELAHGGTLFLDEIGDLPPEIQPKLLRALQEGRFERVGGESTVSVSVRIVAATHVDLAAAVAANSFREDLYYRLAVFPLRLPPLRERGDDAILIAELFAERLRARPGWSELSFSAEALDVIAKRPWPGNVRELRNAIERAAILARGGRIGASELCPGDPRGRPGPACMEADGPTACGAADTTLEAVERLHVEAALRRSHGKIYGPGGAAEALGLKPSTLQSRLMRMGLDRRAFG